MDFLSGSYHSIFTIDRFVITMALTFESTHEYYLRDPDVYYCADHNTLILCQECEDRVLIAGIKEETMLKFARKLVQEDLDKTLAKYEDKDAAKEPADVES